jgi:hypothetical protein
VLLARQKIRLPALVDVTLAAAEFSDDDVSKLLIKQSAIKRQERELFGFAVPGRPATWTSTGEVRGGPPVSHPSAVSRPMSGHPRSLVSAIVRGTVGKPSW